MRKLLFKVKFIFRLAYKNIIYTKLRSLILFITFIILLSLSIMAFSTKPFLNDFFFHYHFNKYEYVDLVLTYDENSNVRYFSSRELFNNINIDDEFNFVAPFFETKSLLEVDNDNYTYVKIMAANIESLKNINNNVPENITEIGVNEIFITTTISEKYNIDKNDYVKLYIGNEQVDLKVSTIIEDDGLIYDNTIFIDKDSYISYFLKALGIKNPSPILMKNIYNTIYFDVKDNSKIPIIKENIEDISYYKDLHLIVNETINYEMIEESVNNNSSLFYLAFSFILFAVILVLQSTLNLIFEERKTQIGIIKILGGNKKFTFFTFLTEFLIYFIPAIIFSYILTNIIVNNGLKYIDMSFKYRLPLKNTFFGILFIFIVLIIITIYNYLKIFKIPQIQLSKTNTNYKDKPYINLIVFLICIIIIIITNYIRLDIKIKALIKILFALLLIFTTTKLLLTSLKFILRFTKKKNFFSLISSNILNSNKIIKQIINVLIISFIIIIFLTGLKDYVSKRTNVIKENINIDFAVTNIVNNLDNTFEKLQKKDNLSSIDKAYLHNNVYIKEIENVFRYNVSLNPNNIENYFNINLDSKTKYLLAASTPYVLLPIKYKHIYDLNIGDKVTLSINQSYDNEEFYILGYIDIGISDFVISNMNIIDKYKELKPNTILLNLKDNDPNFQNDIIKEYSQNMYNVINFNLLIDNIINLFLDVMQYFTFIILIMIICFMLTIFNNSILQFSSLKPLYSRLRVLGCSYKELSKNIIFEIVIIVFVTTFSILLIFPIIKNNLKYLLLFFNSFENINISFKAVIIGCLLATIMYLISNIYYFIQLKKMDYSRILKINNC